MIHWPENMATSQVASMRNVETYSVGFADHEQAEVREAAYDVLHYLQRLAEAVRRLSEATEEE